MEASKAGISGASGGEYCISNFPFLVDGKPVSSFSQMGHPWVFAPVGQKTITAGKGPVMVAGFPERERNVAVIPAGGTAVVEMLSPITEWLPAAWDVSGDVEYPDPGDPAQKCGGHQVIPTTPMREFLRPIPEISAEQMQYVDRDEWAEALGGAKVKCL